MFDDAPASVALTTIHDANLTDSGRAFLVGWLMSTLGDRAPEIADAAIKAMREVDSDMYFSR